MAEHFIKTHSWNRPSIRSVNLQTAYSAIFTLVSQKSASKHKLLDMWESSLALKDPILYCSWRPSTQNYDLPFLGVCSRHAAAASTNHVAAIMCLPNYSINKHDYSADANRKSNVPDKALRIKKSIYSLSREAGGHKLF